MKTVKKIQRNGKEKKTINKKTVKEKNKKQKQIKQDQIIQGEQIRRKKTTYNNYRLHPREPASGHG